MSQLKIKNGGSWEAIPAGGIGVPSGGSSGQYLKKSSSTDYATEWYTPYFPYAPTYTSITNLFNNPFPEWPTNSSAETFTAPSDGWFYLFADRNDTGYTLYVNINGQSVVEIPCYNGKGICSIFIPLRAGQTVNLKTDNSSGVWRVRVVSFIT